MDYHCYIQCKKFMVECKNCETEIYPNDPERRDGLSEDWLGSGKHNCVKALKMCLKTKSSELKEAQEELQAAKDFLKDAREKIDKDIRLSRTNRKWLVTLLGGESNQQLNQIKCVHGCLMELIEGEIPPEYNGHPRCDECRQTSL